METTNQVNENAALVERLKAHINKQSSRIENLVKEINTWRKKYGKFMDDSYITDKTRIFEVIIEKEMSWHYADKGWE